MKIRCLSGCLFFTMGFLAVSPAPAQEAGTAATPAAPAAGAGEDDSRPPRTDAQPADAARIAVLEARVATLERELRHLRAAMKSAGAALSSAAASGDVGEGRLAAEARGSGSDSGNIPGANAPGSPEEERNRFHSLSATARTRFVEELRARQHELSNASPEEREAMVREAMERARSAADGAGSGSGTTNSASASTIPLPPVAPTVARDASAVPVPAPAVRDTTVTSTDASRQRFEALSEEQRRRFMDEMRKNREKLVNATPAEREALTKEALTKVEKEKEKEAGKSGGGGTAGESKTPVDGNAPKASGGKR